MGRPLHETMCSEFAGPVSVATDVMKNKLSTWMAAEKRGTPLAFFPDSSEVRYEPKGVVLCIGASNFPIATCLTHAVTILAAGNCCVIKPSHLTPACAALCEKLVAGVEGLACVN